MAQAYRRGSIIAMELSLPYDGTMRPKVALVQMVSGADVETNLGRMRKWIEEAAAKGAQAIVFPELAYHSAPPDLLPPVVGQYKKMVERFCQWAKEFEIVVIPGSLREPSPKSPTRFFNTLPVISETGTILAEYRKIFLFRASLSDRSYDETQFCDAGNEVKVVETSLGELGLSICFDLRFPELFRSLKKRGAQIILLPAAFTVPTGKVHWKPLLTARAIENQVFIVAPGQVGKSGEGSEKYGHSLVVSPWGEVLTDLALTEGMALVEIDLAAISESSRRVDTWGCRREEIFSIP